jgi:CBS domain-containing protein/anti-sigma regulatory factor (Ser/Thr protein kinase)
MAGDRSYTKIQELTYELRVRDAMVGDVAAVSPKQPIRDLRDLMRERRISGAPVVENGKVVGIVSIEDYIKCLAQREIDVPIAERMTTGVEILHADEPLVHAVGKFDQYGFGRFPVIERNGRKLVGIVTKGDIIRCLLKKLEVEYHEEEIHQYRASHIFEDIVADNTNLVLNYDIAGRDFDRAGQSASKLKKALHRLDIEPEVLRRIAIAAFEAEMNIIVFTDGGQLSASVSPQRITITASDSGPGIADIEQAMQPSFTTAPDWVRELGFGAGMGLCNIKNCTDNMNLVSEVGKGTTLQAVVYLGRGEAVEEMEAADGRG